MLDEATASVDNDADAAVQTMIRDRYQFTDRVKAIRKKINILICLC